MNCVLELVFSQYITVKLLSYKALMHEEILHQRLDFILLTNSCKQSQKSFTETWPRN